MSSAAVTVVTLIAADGIMPAFRTDAALRRTTRAVARRAAEDAAGLTGFTDSIVKP